MTGNDKQQWMRRIDREKKHTDLMLTAGICPGEINRMKKSEGILRKMRRKDCRELRRAIKDVLEVCYE